MGESGKQEEAQLAAYHPANDLAELTASIIQALASGVSTREMRNVQAGAAGVGKSKVSRLWQQAGHKFGKEFRDRDIASQNWGALMLDRIRLSKDRPAFVECTRFLYQGL